MINKLPDYTSLITGLQQQLSQLPKPRQLSTSPKQLAVFNDVKSELESSNSSMCLDQACTALNIAANLDSDQ